MQEGGYAEIRMTDDKSASVPQEAKQAEEVKRIAAWAEPSVWTRRMLTALVTGVKGERWAERILCRARALLLGRSPRLGPVSPA